jgi:hypothetical protein
MSSAFSRFGGRGSLSRTAPAVCLPHKRGQSLIETCLALAIICLIFFGLFQVSQLAAAREILNHAAARGARAKTVGFNDFMVTKAVRVAAIPVSGKLLEPVYISDDTTLVDMIQNMRPGEIWDEILSNTTPNTGRYDLETGRIPEYLGADDPLQASYVLDYEDWDSIAISYPGSVPGGTIVDVNVSMDYPLRVPLHRAFYAPQSQNSEGFDIVPLQGTSGMENHYPLYLE